MTPDTCFPCPVDRGHDVALLEGGELHPVAQWPQARTVITYPRAGERWLADPAQYLIRMPDIYDAATERVSLHVGHPFTHDPDTVFAQLVARAGGPVPSYEFTGNPAAREQPPRPKPPW
jgi:hypothetical protein